MFNFYTKFASSIENPNRKKKEDYDPDESTDYR